MARSPSAGIRSRCAAVITQANAPAAEFITRVGRRKLIMPTYSELVKTPQGLKLAQDTFAKARPGYHPITTASVEDTITKAQQAGASPQAK